MQWRNVLFISLGSDAIILIEWLLSLLFALVSVCILLCSASIFIQYSAFSCSSLPIFDEMFNICRCCWCFFVCYCSTPNSILLSVYVIYKTMYNINLLNICMVNLCDVIEWNSDAYDSNMREWHLTKTRSQMQNVSRIRMEKKRIFIPGMTFRSIWTVVCDKQRKTTKKKCIKTHKHTVVSCRFCLNAFSLLHFAFFLFVPQPCYHLDVLIDFFFHSYRLLNRLKSSFKRYSNHVNNKMSILMMAGPI